MKALIKISLKSRIYFTLFLLVQLLSFCSQGNGDDKSPNSELGPNPVNNNNTNNNNSTNNTNAINTTNN